MGKTNEEISDPEYGVDSRYLSEESKKIDGHMLNKTGLALKRPVENLRGYISSIVHV